MKVINKLSIVLVFISVSLNASVSNNFLNSINENKEKEIIEKEYYENINTAIVQDALITTQRLKKTSETIFVLEKHRNQININIKKGK